MKIAFPNSNRTILLPTLIFDLVVILVAFIGVSLFVNAAGAVGEVGLVLPAVGTIAAILVGGAIVDAVVVRSVAAKGQKRLLVAYLAVTRLALSWLVFAGTYANFSALPKGDSQLQWYYLAAMVLIVSTGAVSIGAVNRQGLGYKVVLGVAGLLVIGELYLTMAMIGVVPKGAVPGAGTRSDFQAEYDIDLLHQDVEAYLVTNNRLPITLAEATADPQSMAKQIGIPTARINSYEYKPTEPGTEFAICSTFNTDTTAKALIVNSPEYWHHAGKQCIHFTK